MKLWEKGEKIGAGGEGNVYRARLLPEHPLFRYYPSLVLAVKSAVYTEYSTLPNEERLLKKFMDCPQIIRIFSSDITYEEKDGKSYINILMEYAAGGSLHDRIYRARGGISEFEAREYTESILYGLSYIHSRGYVHCDLKPDNILIVNGMAKIADLGITMKVEKISGQILGTWGYRAPESIKFGEYDTAADIWALGCCLFEMLTGTMYWRDEPNYEIESILKESRMSNEARDFLSKCLDEDPKDRWDADALLLHPFIVGDSCFFM